VPQESARTAPNAAANRFMLLFSLRNEAY